MHMLIGMIGFAGAGKDTAAEALLGRGFERRAFADALKAVALAMGWDGVKDERGRRFLQDLGLACREHIHERVWLDAALRDIEGRDVVITDVRFLNEAEAVREAGGILVRVVRPGVGPANDHVSELQLLEWPADITLTNAASPADLHFAMLSSIGLDDGVGARHLRALP